MQLQFTVFKYDKIIIIIARGMQDCKHFSSIYKLRIVQFGTSQKDGKGKMKYMKINITFFVSAGNANEPILL